jgi:hypothetical protein
MARTDVMLTGRRAPGGCPGSLSRSGALGACPGDEGRREDRAGGGWPGQSASWPRLVAAPFHRPWPDRRYLAAYGPWPAVIRARTGGDGMDVSGPDNEHFQRPGSLAMTGRRLTVWVVSVMGRARGGQDLAGEGGALHRAFLAPPGGRSRGPGRRAAGPRTRTWRPHLSRPGLARWPRPRRQKPISWDNRPSKWVGHLYRGVTRSRSCR